MKDVEKFAGLEVYEQLKDEIRELKEDLEFMRGLFERGGGFYKLKDKYEGQISLYFEKEEYEKLKEIMEGSKNERRSGNRRNNHKVDRKRHRYRDSDKRG